MQVLPLKQTFNRYMKIRNKALEIINYQYSLLSRHYVFSQVSVFELMSLDGYDQWNVQNSIIMVHVRSNMWNDSECEFL